MHRPAWGSAAVVAALLAACDSSPTDPNRGPDGQLIPTACESSNTVSLEVGETAEFLGAYSRFFCVDTGEGGDEAYTLVVLSTADESLNYTARFGTTPWDGTPPTPAPTPTPAGAPSATAETHDEDFHRRLREWELRELTPLVRPAGDSRTTAAPGAPAPVPTVGTILELNAQANPGGLPGGACEIPRNIDARVEVVSERAIVVADVDNPAGGFTSADYQRYAAHFDTLLAPVAEAHFGVGSDIDQNGGRTILVFTKEVNLLTATNASSFTAGFFFSRDLFPKQAQGNLLGCPNSNEAEILYLLVPDPGGIYGKSHIRFSVDQITMSTIIHEYQHLINASRRLHINRNPSASWSEEPWLNEGLSHIAEELLAFRASGLGPRRNISEFLLSFVGLQADAAIRRHQKLNFERFFEFLRSPELNSPFGPGLGLASRGASWNFLRYLADRTGENQVPFFRALVDSPTRGLENLSDVVGSQSLVFERMADWRVAVYADNRVPELTDRHHDLSWHLPSLYDLFDGPGSYPIQTRALPAGSSAVRTLSSGGASYLRLTLPGDALGEVDIRVNNALPPPTLRATILRTQ